MADFLTELDDCFTWDDDFFDELERVSDPYGVFVNRRKPVPTYVPKMSDMAVMKNPDHGEVTSVMHRGQMKIVTYEDGFERVKLGTMWIN